MKRYRFKTLEEFEGQRPPGWNPYGDMDKYMGQEIHYFGEIPLEKICETDKAFILDGWTFRGAEIVEIKEEQDTPQRIPKEDWADFKITTKTILGVEMQSGNKYFLQLNSEGIINVNLKEHEDADYSDTLNLYSILTTLNMLKGNKKVFQFNSMQNMIAWATS